MPIFHPNFFFEIVFSFFLINFYRFSKLSLIILCQVSSVLLNFVFCSKTSFFNSKITFFRYFGPIFYFIQNIFPLSIYAIFFWFFELSTISLCQLSSFLSTFCNFLLKNHFFEKKLSFFLINLYRILKLWNMPLAKT